MNVTAKQGFLHKISLPLQKLTMHALNVKSNFMLVKQLYNTLKVHSESDIENKQ